MLKTLWQTISGAVRLFFSPLLHLVARRRPPKGAGEMSARDFKVPLRDAVLRRLEVWGPVLVCLAAGLVLLAVFWWLK